MSDIMNPDLGIPETRVAFPTVPSGKIPAGGGITVDGLGAVDFSVFMYHVLEARDRAYCPYSNFRVGATFITKGGLFISGANVENAAYPSGMCAERCALGTAIGTAGLGRGDFKALGVGTDLRWDRIEGSTKGFCSPCGFCRQVLREFCDLDMPIFMFDADGAHIVKTLEELLPMSFGPETLPAPVQLPQHERKLPMGQYP